MVGKDKVVAGPVNVGSYVARNLDDAPQAIDELSTRQVAAQAGQALGQRAWLRPPITELPAGHLIHWQEG
jgi:hypothetical protein